MYLGLLGLLLVLMELTHEWRPEETDQKKDLGLGMNPRKAILWHASEFMSDAHARRLRTGLRRKLSSNAARNFVDPKIEVLHPSIIA